MMRAREKGLEDRVRKLEAAVRGHERELDRLRRLTAPDGEEAGPESTERGLGSVQDGGAERFPGPAAPEEAAGRAFGEAWWGVELPFDPGKLRRWEWWLNKVGIALFLMGVVFLFKFSWDRGWLQVLLTPPVRVCLGILLGTALVCVGLRVYAGRRAFAQVVLGGGIGTYYITGFGAFQMLGVFSYPVAFGYMAAVTLLAFALALRQGGAALAVIGATGGFVTPFLLYDGAGAVGGLAIHAGLVLAGTMGTYLFKGWRSLLVVAFAGYWVVMFTGYAGVAGAATPVTEAATLQAGAIFGWLSLWLVPVARETLRIRRPARWRVLETIRPAGFPFGKNWPPGDGVLACLVSFASPTMLLVATWILWDPEKRTLGLVTLGIAVFYGLTWTVLRRAERRGNVPYAQAVVALAFATLSLALLLEGEALLFVLALEAAALHFVSRRRSDRILAGIGHALFVVCGTWTFYLILFCAIGRTLDPYAGSPFSGWYALAGFAVVILAFVSSTALAELGLRRAYRFFAYAAAAGLLWCELVPFGGGSWALISLALYATGLHVLSRRRPEWGSVGVSNLLSVFVGCWLAGRLAAGIAFPGEDGMAVFNPGALVDLCVVALTAASSRFVRNRPVAVAYRVSAHAALLAWLWCELAILPGAPDAYVTVAWGLCGAAMFVAGLRLDHAHLIKGGVATLFLVVAKLFLWDLAELEPVWRVLLFLGFGGLFLVLSYHLRNLWNPRPDCPGLRAGGEGA